MLFSVLFATTIAFFIFSGAFYSQGAYNITPGTFNLMGVIPHVWAEPIPWLNIFATLAIYLMILLAARFLKYVLFKDVQDEVSKNFNKLVCSKLTVHFDHIITHDRPLWTRFDMFLVHGNTTKRKGRIKEKNGRWFGRNAI